MKRLVPSGAVLLTLIVAVALVAPQSASATSLALKPGHYTFVCDSGTNVLQLNGKAVTKAGVPVKCSDMNTLTVEIGTPGTTTPSTVDLRGVTGTDPGHFSGSMVYVYGPLTFLGSPVSDYVYTASGVLHGYGGADSLSGGLVAYGDVSVPAMIYGDDGNDRLACQREGNCVLDGGLGNDVFAHWGRGSSTGGPGDDVTSQSRVPFDGGDGTDWVLLGNDSHLKVTAVAGTTNSVKIASDWATYTAKAVERVKFSATGAVTATMSPGVRYVIDICSYPNTLTVRVPAATWTQTDTLITAPGLAKVLLVTFFPCAVDPAAVNVVGV